MAFDPNAATARYIDSLGPAALQKAHDYTVGKEWMLLWAFAVAAIVTWLIVRSGILDKLDAKLAEKRRNLRAFVVTLVYFIVSAILTPAVDSLRRLFPRKGLWPHQPAARGLPWPAGHRARHHGADRRPVHDGRLLADAPHWEAVVDLVGRADRDRLFLPHPACAGADRAPVQQIRAGAAGPGPRRGGAMARRAGIPPNEVYMFNGSRQSNNFTANAGGVGSTARVAISDVAFKNASLDEVRAVTGHEIGHYVLKHTWCGSCYSIAAIVLFWIADRDFPRFARLFGSSADHRRPARGAGAAVHGLAIGAGEPADLQ